MRGRWTADSAGSDVAERGRPSIEDLFHALRLIDIIVLSVSVSTMDRLIKRNQARIVASGTTPADASSVFPD